MTIKRSQLAAWLESTCDKQKPYTLSAVVDGTRECGMLRHGYGKGRWQIGMFGDEREGFILADGFGDLPWSDVRVRDVVLDSGNGVTMLGLEKRFTPPPRTVTLEADAEKWESLRKKSGCGWSITIDEFVDSAKVKG